MFKLEGISNWAMPSAFLLKVLVGLLLFLMHIQTYGVDELSHDGETFFKEGKLLHDIYFKSQIDYFKLLTGIGENEALVHKHLSMTEYWSAGDLSIINDSKNVIRVHSIIHFFSMNSVYIHLAVMCFLTLIAHRLLFITFRPFIKLSGNTLFWTLLLVPSTIYWTSSIMKEPMMFLGISLFLFTILRQHTPWKLATLFILSISLLLGYKPYILVCLLSALTGVLFYRFVFKYRLVPTLITLSALLVLSLSILDKPRDQVVNYLTRKQFDFVNVGKGGLHAAGDTCIYYFQPNQYDKLNFENNRIISLKEPIDAYSIRFGSTQKPLPVHLDTSVDSLQMIYFAPGCNSFVETTPIDNSVSQLVKNVPEALVNSVLRPFPWDPGSKLKYLSIIEVWLIFAFVIYAIVKRKRINKKTKTLIFGLLVFSITLFLLIGWTTPVIGAIARYRFPAQLALVLIGLIIINPKKIFRHA